MDRNIRMEFFHIYPLLSPNLENYSTIFVHTGLLEKWEIFDKAYAKSFGLLRLLDLSVFVRHSVIFLWWFAHTGKRTGKCGCECTMIVILPDKIN